MPNLVAIDVSVTDGRVRLAFSDRAVATAYAAYLRAQDLRPPHHQAIPGYRRAPHLHSTAKLVTLSLPEFITWYVLKRRGGCVTLCCTTPQLHPSRECGK